MPALPEFNDIRDKNIFQSIMQDKFARIAFFVLLFLYISVRLMHHHLKYILLTKKADFAHLIHTITFAVLIKKLTILNILRIGLISIKLSILQSAKNINYLD